MSVVQVFERSRAIDVPGIGYRPAVNREWIQNNKDVAPGRVAILLCTKDGASYLNDQLASIACQTITNWRLIVSDDGSVDNTVAIIQDFAAKWPGRVELRVGPQTGARDNFLSLACDGSIEADYFAFCDQDDVWHPNKLQRALSWLSHQPFGTPAMYCGRTRLVDTDGSPIGYSPRFGKGPSFPDAMVQSIAGGNTMVFNRKARSLLTMAGNTQPVAHDWWTYQLVVGAGGQVNYDVDPSIDYRQHAGNLVGTNIGLKAQGKRASALISGRFCEWNAANIKALKACAHLLTPENRSVLADFERARSSGLLSRHVKLLRTGVHRQTRLGHTALMLALALGKI